MPFSDSLLSKIDLDLLLERLTACAGKWFLQRGCTHPEDILPGTGKSAIDLTYETLARFIEGKISFEPRQKENINGEVYALLKTVIWRDFLDLVKPRREYAQTTVMDVSADSGKKAVKSHRKQTLDQFAQADELHFEALNKALLLRRVTPCLDGDKDLEEYVFAVVEHGCIKREDIVAFLNISPQEATNRQRNLRTKLASWARKASFSDRKT